MNWAKIICIVLLACLLFIGMGSKCPWDKDSSSNGSSGDDIVYITETGDKYHRSNCRYLSQSKIPIERREAIRQGYTACSVCKP